MSETKERSFGEKISTRGNRSTRRKPVEAPFWEPQIPHDGLRNNPRLLGESRATRAPATAQHQRSGKGCA